MGFVKSTNVESGTFFYSQNGSSIIRAGGSLYVIMENLNTDTIEIFKSSDSGDNWSIEDSVTDPNTIGSVMAYPAYDVTNGYIAFVYRTGTYAIGMGTGSAIHIVIYDTSTDAVVEQSLIIEVESGSGSSAGYICYDDVTEEYWLNYRGPDRSVMGTSYQSTFLGHRSTALSSSWTLGIDTGMNAQDANSIPWWIIKDAHNSDRLHFCSDNNGIKMQSRVISTATNGTVVSTNASNIYAYTKPLQIDESTYTRFLWRGTISDDPTYWHRTTNTSYMFSGDNSTEYQVVNSNNQLDAVGHMWHVINPDDGTHQVFQTARYDGSTRSGLFQIEGTPTVVSTYENNFPWAGPFADVAGFTYPFRNLSADATAITWLDGSDRYFAFIAWDDTTANNDIMYVQFTPFSAVTGPQTVATSIDAILFKTNITTDIDAIILGSGTRYVPLSDYDVGSWTTAPLWSKIDEFPISDADFITDPTSDYASKVSPVFEIESTFNSAINKFAVGATINMRGKSNGGGTATNRSLHLQGYDVTADTTLLTGGGRWVQNDTASFVEIGPGDIDPTFLRDALDASHEIGLGIEFDGSLFTFTFGFNVSGLNMTVLRFDDVPSAGISAPYGDFGPVYWNSKWYCIVRDGTVSWLLSSVSPPSAVSSWDVEGPIANHNFTSEDVDDAAVALFELDGSLAFWHWRAEYDWIVRVGPSSDNRWRMRISTGEMDTLGNVTYRTSFGVNEKDDGGSSWYNTIRYLCHYNNATRYGFAIQYVSAVTPTYNNFETTYNLSDDSFYGGENFTSNTFHVVSSVSHLTSEINHHFMLSGAWNSATGTPRVETIRNSIDNSAQDVSADTWKGGIRGINHNNKVVFPAARILGGVRAAVLTSAYPPTISEQVVSTRDAYKAAYEWKQTVVAVPQGTNVWVFWLDATNDAVWAAFQPDGDTTWTEYGEVVAGGSSYTYLGAGAGPNGTIGIVVSSDAGTPEWHLFDPINSVDTTLDGILQLTSTNATSLDAILNAAATSPTVSHNYDFTLSQRLTISSDYDFRLISRVEKDHDYDFILYQVVDLSPTINIDANATAALTSETQERELTGKGTVTSGEGTKRIYLPGHKIVKR